MHFVWQDVVRDYELDYQGIVNNSNYLRYMEHARHQHLVALGVDFAKLHELGTDLVLVSSQINFKNSLRSGDHYIVTSDFSLEGRIRFKTTQQIMRASDQLLIAEGEHICVAISTDTRRPKRFDALTQKILDNTSVPPLGTRLHTSNSTTRNAISTTIGALIQEVM